MEIIQKQVLSSDGVHQLKGKIYLPESEPKGYFHVVHGMREYLGRYDGFLREIAAAGYIAFGYDHLGHGETALPGEHGFIAHTDGWRRLVEDVGVFYKAVKADYGDLPYCLMGHSMGSFIVRLAAVDLPVDRLIVMGTGGPNPAASAGILLARFVKLCRGERHVSNLIDGMAFGSYNKRWPADGLAGWLTKDAAVRERYMTDPFCQFRFSVSAMQDLVTLNKESNLPAWFEKAPACPILLISGAEDPVGNYGEGVRVVEQKLLAAGKQVKLVLYPNARHEILNDDTREQVIQTLLDFAR